MSSKALEVYCVMPFVIVMGNANRQEGEGSEGGREVERGLQLEPQERSDDYFPELCLSRPYPDKTFAFVAAIVPGRELGASVGEGRLCEGEGSGGGGTCYTCNLCNNASRVFAFAFSKIEAIGPYAYFRTCPTSSTPTPTSLTLPYPTPLQFVLLSKRKHTIFIRCAFLVEPDELRRHGTKSRHL